MKYITQKLLMIMVILFFPLSSYSSYYFSYITDVDEKSSSTRTYSFVMKNWELTAPFEPNPCVQVLGSKGAKKCYLSINHYHKIPNEGGSSGSKSMPWKCAINFAEYSSLNEIYNDAFSKCGLSLPLAGTSYHTGGSKNVDECIGFFLNTKSSHAYGYLLPGGVCGIAPPPVGKCYFNVPNGSALQLNHGTLSLEEVNNNYVAENFEISCNKDMPVRVNASIQTSTVKLRDDGSLLSTVTLDGNPASLGKIVQINANRLSQLTIASRLKTNGTVAPGRFKGTITLVLTIP